MRLRGRERERVSEVMYLLDEANTALIRSQHTVDAGTRVALIDEAQRNLSRIDNRLGPMVVDWTKPSLAGRLGGHLLAWLFRVTNTPMTRGGADD